MICQASLPKNEVSIRSIVRTILNFTASNMLSRQNCLYLLRTVYIFFNKFLCAMLQKRNFGRKQQINVCPKLGFDACNFGQFSIKKLNDCARRPALPPFRDALPF